MMIEKNTKRTGNVAAFKIITITGVLTFQIVCAMYYCWIANTFFTVEFLEPMPFLLSFILILTVLLLLLRSYLIAFWVASFFMVLYCSQMSLFGALYFYIKMPEFFMAYYPLYAISLSGLAIRWLLMGNYKQCNQIAHQNQPFLIRGYFIPFYHPIPSKKNKKVEFYGGTDTARKLKIAWDSLFALAFFYFCIQAINAVPHMNKYLLLAIVGSAIIPFNLFFFKIVIYGMLLFFSTSRNLGKKIQLVGLDFKGE